jgi:nucleotide-binding universal stress UspA family protein
MASPEFPRPAAIRTRRTPGGDRKWGPILVGTDGSESASRAVEAAGDLAVDLNAELWIAHVVEGSSETGATQFARTEGASIGDATEVAARRILIEAAQKAEARSGRKPHTVLRWGGCPEELIAAAGKVGATAIVVGRRGAGGRLAEALIGSVSQKLAGISPVNLVIVP